MASGLTRRDGALIVAHSLYRINAFGIACFSYIEVDITEQISGSYMGP